MSCGIGRRHGSDLAWLWLWCRGAAAAPIGPLAWELPYALGVALKKKNAELTEPCTSVRDGQRDPGSGMERGLVYHGKTKLAPGSQQQVRKGELKLQL